MNQSKKWFLVALVSVLLTAPNNTIIRVGVTSVDPYYWIAVRSLIVTVVCLPWIVRAWRVIQKRWKNLAIAGTSFTFAIITYTIAIYQSQASYVAILTLITPVILMIISARIFRDKVSRRSLAGVTLAIIGALVLVVLPIALKQNSVVFYPSATVLTLVQCVAYAYGIVYMRRANEDGIAMPAVIGVTAVATTAVAALLFAVYGNHAQTSSDVGFWLAVIYSGVVASLIARAINVLSYERIGAAVIAALTYFETFIAILIPVFVLHEQLSPAMVLGGILILLGVYVVEHHKHPHAKHHFIHRTH